MRRFPAIGLAITLLSLPLVARAAVPDPRVQRELVGSTGPASNATAIGDVTGDGASDLIVARADGTVAVFEGPLTGTLPSSPTFTVTPSAASDAYRLAVGDLNGDGFGDLVVAAVDGVPAPGIDVFLGVDSSPLPAAPDTTLTPVDVRDVAVADLNGDTLDDLLYTQTASTKTEVVLAVQDTGALTAGVTLDADAPASGLSLGDVNGDGLADFALDGVMSAPIPVYVQSDVDHSFARTDVPLPDAIAAVSGVVLSDVNNDLSDDLLVVTNTDELSWALADGASPFGSFSPTVAAAPVSAKEVGDLNDDGLADLATFGSDGSVRIYLQQAGGGLGAACSFPGQASPGDDAATAIGDLTGDATTDLVDADVAGATGGAWLYRQLTGTELLPISIDATPSKTTIRASKKLTISGTLHDPEGGCLRNGSVTLMRTPGGVVDDAPIGTDGSFVLTDTPNASGSYSYAVSFSGDETHEASASSPMNVTVTKMPTSLTLKATHSTITFGATTTLRATLAGGTASSRVVFELRTGGAWQTIDSPQVGADGIATLKVQPAAKARYRAEFLSTPARAGSTSADATVQVHAVMVSRMIGKGNKHGAYTVYACCTAYFYVKLRPVHPSVKWTAVAQYYGNGKWRSLGSGTYTMERDGDAAIYLSAPKGYRYRVKGVFAGDGDHLGATSAWNYFRFR